VRRILHLTTYILRDIFMAKIEFYRDDNGHSQAHSLLLEIEEKAKVDPSYSQLYYLILNGLNLIKRHGLPLINSLVQLEKEDGSPYSIRLVKDLVKHKDLFEFRIDWKEVGAFRAIFFQFKFHEEEVIFITKAIIKDKTYSPEFDIHATESEIIKGKFKSSNSELHKGDNSNE
jgi:hypothetical protein